MTIAKSVLNSAYFLWAVLALPSIPIILALSGGGNRQHSAAEEGLEIAGIFSALLLVTTLALSPMLALLPKSRAIRWLLQRRRYFGVAAFAYTVVHVALYFIDLRSLSAALGDLTSPVIVAGWLALFIFIPLALTSNALLTHLLGWRRWKLLQRSVYAAAVLVLAHWVLVEPEFLPIALATLLAALEGFRIWRTWSTRRARQPLPAT